MIVALFLLVAVVFWSVAVLLTAAEAAFAHLPQSLDPEADRPHRGMLAEVLAHPLEYRNALAFWRIWCEMAAAVALALLFVRLFGPGWLAGLCATVAITVSVVILLGLAPRRFGRQHALPVARWTARLVHVLRLVLGPGPQWMVEFTDTRVSRQHHDNRETANESELRDFVEAVHASDSIEEAEAELIQSVFALEDTLVRAVMVPRTDMVAISQEASWEHCLQRFIQTGFSRIPVFGESSDEVLGVLYLKDLVAAQQDPQGLRDRPGALARPVRFVPESKLVGELLRELQSESTHVAIVVDEYGGTAGLVTLEDLLEVLVGEIIDEYDDPVPQTSEDLGSGRYRVSSRLSVTELGELFHLKLDDDEVNTTGGLLAKHLGRVPVVGSETVVHNIVLRAERLEGRSQRVRTLIVEPASEIQAQERAVEIDKNGGTDG